MICLGIFISLLNKQDLNVESVLSIRKIDDLLLKPVLTRLDSQGPHSGTINVNSSPTKMIKHRTAHQYLLKKHLGGHVPWAMKGNSNSKITFLEKMDYSRYPLCLIFISRYLFLFVMLLNIYFPTAHKHMLIVLIVINSVIICKISPDILSGGTKRCTINS